MALKVAWSLTAVLAFLVALKWWLEPTLRHATDGLFLSVWTK